MKIHLPVRRAILRRKTVEAPAEDRQHKLRLDLNENTAGCSAVARRALARLTSKQIATYPEYLRSTRHLARYFSIRPSELLLANGGDDALRVFFDAFVDTGSSILICEPTFPMYRYYAEIFGARIISLGYDREMHFPLSAALAALQKNPRVLFIANPNNPTGTLLPAAAIRQILRAATHTAVVLDEAYAEISGATVVPWIRRFPQLFVARTFSKAAGLAGLRLGAVIARADSLAPLRRAMPPFAVNVAALVAAEAAVRHPAAIRRYVRDVRSVRQWFSVKLQQLGARTFPSAGNFLLADFGPPGPALFRHLHYRGILVRERSREFAPGFVRITIGTRREMRQLLAAIRDYQASHRSPRPKRTVPALAPSKS